MRNVRWFALMPIAALLAFAACGGGDNAPATSPAPPPPETPAPAAATTPEPGAVAELTPREGTTVAGTVTFTAVDGGVAIAAEVTGVDGGAAAHGFHLHEIGDCSAADFTSTGGHFNPGASIHGGPDDAERHGGDFGNIEIGDDGSGSLALTSDLLSIDDGPNGVIGRAIILHEGTDDLESQPTGAAGGRIACGVVVATGDGGGGGGEGGADDGDDGGDG